MKNKASTTVEEIENLLPQTQCGLCTYEGCKPYATAMQQGEANIDLCLPGGVKTLKKLGQYFNIDSQPYESGMAEKQKPAMRARIVEDQCIGCTKCIQACPVDAIIGRAKQMHVILDSECTGCELCVEPCPMDCIVMEPIAEPDNNERVARAQLAKTRYQTRQARTQKQRKPVKKTSIKDERQAYVDAALARVKAKKQASPS